MSLRPFKTGANEGIPVPCDDLKTLCRLAKRLRANFNFRIVETFLILLSVVRFIDFWTFFDAGRTLPSSGPILSTSDENESVIVDIWTGKLCCLVRSGAPACFAERFLNPRTAVEDAANRWSGSFAIKNKAQGLLYKFGIHIIAKKIGTNSNIWLSWVAKIPHVSSTSHFFSVENIA